MEVKEQSQEICEYCGHSKAGNAHGPDQNDFDYDPNTDNIVHRGSCTYCKECYGSHALPT